MSNVLANLLERFNPTYRKKDRQTYRQVLPDLNQPHDKLNSTSEVSLHQNEVISVQCLLSLLKRATDLQHCVAKVSCRAADSWREHMMWVRKTRTAGVTVAMLRSPPMERPSVCGLAAYAMLNKPSMSPLR